jgi:type IV pilus assembly protein PilV
MRVPLTWKRKAKFMQLRDHSLHRASGYSLIEVLIAIVIFSFGLIGLAGLQMRSLNYSHVAQMRTLATQQAYDMSDRLRANMVGVMDGRYDRILDTIPADPNCLASGCSPEQLAIFDAFQWNTANHDFLPAGKGTVTRIGKVFKVAVSWDDNRDGGSKTFEVSFEP